MAFGFFEPGRRFQRRPVMTGSRMAQNSGPLCHRNGSRGGLAIVGLIMSLTCLFGVLQQIYIGQMNDWWVDELFALWASDRGLSFSQLFHARIASDSNPPLYFSLLHFVRLAIYDDRLAVIATNVLVLVAAVIVLARRTIRSRYRNWIAFSFMIFVLSGPMAAYLSEARAYGLAMTTCFVAYILAAMAVLEADYAPKWPLFMAVGFAAGMSHVFGALACCSIAMGMLGCGVAFRSSQLAGKAVALGCSAALATFLWMGIWWWLGPGSFAQVSWIPFTANFVVDAGRAALELTYGASWLIIIFALLLSVGMLRRNSRRLATLVMISLVFFISAPIIISFKVPMILPRYWLIGSSLFFASIGLVIGCWTLSGRRSEVVASLLVAGFCVLCLPVGFSTAYAFVLAKPTWRGASMMRDELAKCGPQTVHVLGFLPGFSLTTGAPASTFVNATALTTRTRVGDGCAVLGWSEHYALRYGPSYTANASSEELLDLLKLDYRSDEVVIQRHASGFIIRRRAP